MECVGWKVSAFLSSSSNSSTSLPTGYKPNLLQTRLVGRLVTGGMNSCTLQYKLKAWPSGVT
jgi:hypothetical protein